MIVVKWEEEESAVSPLEAQSSGEKLGLPAAASGSFFSVEKKRRKGEPFLPVLFWRTLLSPPSRLLILGSNK